MLLLLMLMVADETFGESMNNRSDVDIYSFSLLHNRAWRVRWSDVTVANSSKDTNQYVTYTVKYCDTLHYFCIKKFPVSANSVILSELTPNRDYYVTIYSNLEFGVPSWNMRIIKFHTLRSIKCQSMKFECDGSLKESGVGILCREHERHLHTCFTQVVPPTVESYHIVKTTPTSITLQWVPIEDEKFEVNDYTLNCLEEGELVRSLVYHANSLSLVMTTTFEDLKENQVYEFRISVDNSYGNSSKHILTGKTSNESLWYPSLIPNNIDASPISFAESTSYIISWNFLSYVKEILSLSVQYCNEKNTCKVIPKTRSSNVTIIGLIPGSCYSLLMKVYDYTDAVLWKKKGGSFCTQDRDRCKGFSCAGVSQCIPFTKICDGKPDCLDGGSDETEKHGKCKLPPLVKGFQIYKTGHMFILVQWKPLNLMNLNVGAYEVRLDHANISKTIIKKSPMNNRGMNVKWMNASFTDLFPNTTYNLTIRALNSFGYGSWINPITAETVTTVGLPGAVGPHLTEYLLKENALIWRISWTTPGVLGNNYVNELSYLFKYCQINSMYSMTCKSIQTNATNVVLQLRKHTFYQYSIVACNKYGQPSKKMRKKNFLAKRSERSGISCLNEFFIAFDLTKHVVGRYPTIKPRKNAYDVGEFVYFHCLEPFHVNGKKTERRGNSFCMRNGQWSQPWPMCRGNLENVTCKNEYDTSRRDGRSWQNPTLNRVHAEYGPIKAQYYYSDTLQFRCKQGHMLVRTKGLTVMKTTCGSNGRWSREWPLCKGKTCDKLKVPYADVSNQGKRRSIGIVARITCQKDFYLWGSITSKCLPNLEWSGSKHRACYDIQSFKKVCEEDGGSVVNKKNGTVCQYPGVQQKSSSHHTTYLAIGTAIPMSVAFLVTMVGAVFYVRYKRSQFIRYRVACRYNGNETVHLILPTYSESEKNKPTTPPPAYEDSADRNECSFSVPESSASCLNAERGLPPEYSQEVEPSGNVT